MIYNDLIGFNLDQQYLLYKHKSQDTRLEAEESVIKCLFEIHINTLVALYQINISLLIVMYNNTHTKEVFVRVNFSQDVNRQVKKIPLYVIMQGLYYLITHLLITKKLTFFVYLLKSNTFFKLSLIVHIFVH